MPKQPIASSGSISSKPHTPGSAPARKSTTSATKPHNEVSPPEERPASSVLSKLATFASASSDEPKKAASRSSNFREVAAPPPIEPPAALPLSTRDNDLAVIEDLELGPYDHKAPFDDPHFEKLEPNSGIRLSYVFFLCLPFRSETLNPAARAESRTTISRIICEVAIICHHPDCTRSSGSCRVNKGTMFLWKVIG